MAFAAAAALAGVAPAATGAARDVDGTCPSVVEAPFPDVPADHVHAAGVACILQWGITTGRADGTYRPAGFVTRGQMATFVRRLLAAAGQAVPDRSPDDSSHAANLADLVAAGVLPPDATSRAIDARIRRSEMVTWLMSAYRHRWGAEAAAVTAGTYPFVDVPASAPYRDDAWQLWSVGVVTGVKAGTLDPGGEVTRGQMASFLARLLDAVVDGPSRPDFDALSAEAQRLLVESAAATGGRLVRWTTPVRIWIDGSLPAGSVEQAVDFWRTMLIDLGLDIAVVDAAAGANVRLWNTDARPPGQPPASCGAEGIPEGGISDDAIVRGEGRFWLDAPGCEGWRTPGNTWIPIAHGLGHILGLMAHSAPGTDLMSGDAAVGTGSWPLAEAARYLYSVPSGSQPGAS